eukprot:359832-Chlamydomonas_euryale.AAC.14
MARSDGDALAAIRAPAPEAADRDAAAAAMRTIMSPSPLWPSHGHLGRWAPASASEAADSPAAFHCPVHGEFRLPGVVRCVVDTPQFQRLRELKQLGLR